MAEASFTLAFGGYWRDEKKSGLPDKSGIYCVYRCTHNAAERKVSLKELLYIGEASNIRERVASHEKYKDWRSHLKSGEQLCFSAAGNSYLTRERCEAAMIFKHKPPENDEYRDSFPYDTTTMELTDKIALLTPRFTVYQT